MKKNLLFLCVAFVLCALTACHDDLTELQNKKIGHSTAWSGGPTLSIDIEGSVPPLQQQTKGASTNSKTKAIDATAPDGVKTFNPKISWDKLFDGGKKEINKQIYVAVSIYNPDNGERKGVTTKTVTCLLTKLNDGGVKIQAKNWRLTLPETYKTGDKIKISGLLESELLTYHPEDNTVTLAPTLTPAPLEDIDKEKENYLQLSDQKKKIFQSYYIKGTTANQKLDVPLPPIALPLTELDIVGSQQENGEDILLGTFSNVPFIPVGSYIALNAKNYLEPTIQFDKSIYIDTNTFTLQGKFDLTNPNTLVDDGSGRSFRIPSFKDDTTPIIYTNTVKSGFGVNIMKYVNRYIFHGQDGSGDVEELTSNQKSKYYYILWVMPIEYGNILFTSGKCNYKIGEDNYTSEYLQSTPTLTKGYDIAKPLLLKKNSENGPIRYANYTITCKINSDLLISTFMPSSYSYYSDWNGTLLQVYNPTTEELTLANYNLYRVREFHSGTSYPQNNGLGITYNYKHTTNHPKPWYKIDGDDYATYYNYNTLYMNLDLGPETKTKEYNVNVLKKEFTPYGQKLVEAGDTYKNPFSDFSLGGDAYTNSIKKPTPTNCYAIRWTRAFDTPSYNGNMSMFPSTISPKKLIIYGGAAYYGNKIEKDGGTTYGPDGTKIGVGPSIKTACEATNSKVQVFAAVNSTKEAGNLWGPKGGQYDLLGVLSANPGDGLVLTKEAKIRIFGFDDQGKFSPVDVKFQQIIDMVGPCDTQDESVWTAWQYDFNANTSDDSHRIIWARKDQIIFPNPHFEFEKHWYKEYAQTYNFKPRYFGYRISPDNH